MAGRSSGPSYYGSRRGYYAWVRGKQVRLAAGPECPEVEAKAWERFRELVPAVPPKVVLPTKDEWKRLYQVASPALKAAMLALLMDGLTPAEVCAVTAEHYVRSSRTY